MFLCVCECVRVCAPLDGSLIGASARSLAVTKVMDDVVGHYLNSVTSAATTDRPQIAGRPELCGFSLRACVSRDLEHLSTQLKGPLLLRLCLQESCVFV